MDVLQTAVTIGAVVAGHIIQYVASAARSDQRLENMEKTQLQQGKRIDNHDEKFSKLGSEFVPRVELAETLETIKQSQKRTERWLEWLLFNRKQGPPAQGQEGS